MTKTTTSGEGRKGRCPGGKPGGKTATGAPAQPSPDTMPANGHDYGGKAVDAQGVYHTPKEIVKVIEPSCGTGGYLAETAMKAQLSPNSAKSPQPGAAVLHVATGIHPGMSFAEYQAIDAVNQSRLKLFRRTPAHAHWEMTHPEAVTDALRLGDAVHVAVLEPERFAAQYVASPRFDKRTNAGKIASAEWTAANAFKCALTADEYALCDAIRAAVWGHPLAAEMLRSPGQNEVTAFWNDEETGLLCKGRIDRITTFQAQTTILDIKTTRQEATPREFGIEVAKFGYHWQAAFYLDGLATISPRQRRFMHLVIEKDPPHCLALLELDDAPIEEGRRQYRRALEMYKRCTETGEWPGYPVGVYGFDIPNWAYELTSPPK